MWTLKPIDHQASHQFYAEFLGDKTFLQSTAYEDLRAKLSENTQRLGIFQGETLIGTVFIQIAQTKLKRFAHVPHGPLIKLNDENEEAVASFWKWFLAEYINLGKQHKCDFVRISSLLPTADHRLLTSSGFRSAPIHLVNPEKTWILDLTKDEETLLSEMKKSTRYEVRKGIKTGFEVHKGKTNEDLDIFWKLHLETVKRQGFVPFARKLTETELAIFGDQAQIISVLHEGNPLASGVFIFDDRAGYYHQGASTYSKLPAAHAYIWQAILEAKSRGCTEFNFWGVCDQEAKSHPWYGLSKFKRGFGGFERNYAHAHDYPLTPKYWLNWLVETYRKKKRGY